MDAITVDEQTTTDLDGAEQEMWEGTETGWYHPEGAFDIDCPICAESKAQDQFFDTACCRKTLCLACVATIGQLCPFCRGNLETGEAAGRDDDSGSEDNGADYDSEPSDLDY